ncbi:MAG: hypothetical protein JWP25_3336 [Bradyrhizobium sp.]|jgi:hypothetical protein|nr:hypothetical protein [Bradyrhizobium sp.]
MKVKDVMHKGVDWVSPNTPVTELAKLIGSMTSAAFRLGRTTD